MTSVPPALTWPACAAVPKESASAAALLAPPLAPLPSCAGVTAEQPAATSPTAATAPTVAARRADTGRDPRTARNVMELSHRGVTGSGERTLYTGSSGAPGRCFFPAVPDRGRKAR